MKKNLILILLLMIPFSIFGQTYSALWKKADEAARKDLPQTQREVLLQIVEKATKEKAYGQLLKAELTAAQVQASVAPDSLKPAVEALEKRCRAISDDIVLKTVYQTVLWQIYYRNMRQQDQEEGLPQDIKPVLTPALCGQLAQVKDETYNPFVVKGTDSKIFDHDLLSVIGYELDDYVPLSTYYEAAGNRRAACLTALEALKHHHEGGEAYLQQLDSLIKRYGDLDEAGEIAIERFETMSHLSQFTVAERVNYAREAIDRWRQYPHINSLRNAVGDLTHPQYSLLIKDRIALPMREQKVEVESLRNLQSLKMKVYAVKGNGDLGLNPQNESDYKQLKPLLTLLPDACVERHYTGNGKKDYEVYEDSLMLAALPVGVYMLEFSTSPSTETERKMYYVTDLYTLTEEQPDGQIRYVVVSATTGQPVAKANLRIKDYTSWNKYNTHHLVTNGKGECILKERKGRRREVFTYTNTDKASPEMNLTTRYSYEEASECQETTCLFTDRAIYRPGQTVHVALTVYETLHGTEHQTIANKRISFELRDANYKEVKRESAVTDAYGSCAVDFTLPASGLTGMFTIRANGQNTSIRVEEYKRPAFEVSFDPVKEHYAAGDTVTAKATARSYAGVPVQGATVKYKVVRRLAFWWWSYNRYWDTGYIATTSGDDEIASGETQTADDGTFTVDMPMAMPESDHPLFYNFVVSADVTDQAGETHTATYSLPLGNRKTALSVDLADKMLAESNPAMTFHLRNAAGSDIDAQLRYRIDGGEWLTASSNSSLPIPSAYLKSGKHMLEAECEGETLKRDFTVFSLDDKRPATQTDDWFWISGDSFPRDGKPVTLQVGSSAEDVHIVYSIFSGTQCIESGSVDKSNELINRKFTYKEAWGNGLLLTFVWVKENKYYTHSATIRKPLPDKRLTLSWKTFRDRLTPGQEEEWTLTVTGPDGKPADAALMSVLYDKSLDQLAIPGWYMEPNTYLPLPYASWTVSYRTSLSASASHYYSNAYVKPFAFSHFDESVYPSASSYYMRGFGNHNRFGRRLLRAKGVESAMAMPSRVAMDADMEEARDEVASNGYAMQAKESVVQADIEEADEARAEEPVPQLRENLNETAFFYPQLTTDENGLVTLKFTLPESLTTWRFMGLAHTTDMKCGMLQGEAVAKKDVMIQPNTPRFVREGDKATISARIFNTSEKDVTGKATLRLLNPETEAVVYETSHPFSVTVDGTTCVTFNLSSLPSLDLLICQVYATGEGFSDGEQHYLPVLSNTEPVTVTQPFTQIEAGCKTIDLAALLPAGSTRQKLTFEYTNHPAWLMIQALPALGQPIDDNAISQAASLYANSIGNHIIRENPAVKKAFQLWKQEKEQTSLTSSLEKNQELKELLLNETPWVLDAEKETEQKQRLADFFDENAMQHRLSSAISKLKKLQKSNGSWTWWPNMPGSFYMTVAVSEMLVRLNMMTGSQKETAQMLTDAFGFMGKEVVEEVNQMKRDEKKGIRPYFPSFKCLQWLYLSSLDGRSLPSTVEEANRYLLKLLKKDIKRQTIYEKAMTAVILAKSPLLNEEDRVKALEYVQSLKEYTVYREEMGRYYDTPRAGYSWYDYKIPTQTMAIEALQCITPTDRQTIMEMQRWLLQSKRTQAWDTPINSVNAVYAFLNGSSQLSASGELAILKVDGKPLEQSKATAAIGYVKAPLEPTSKTLTVEKSTNDTSWGAAYAQFMQPARDIKDMGAGLSVKRELFMADGQQLTNLKVGDRIKVRITITSDRDYDFVQLIDRRAACLEPVRQLSGYHSGSYCTPRDNSTNYYFDRLSKGIHVIETDYYIDRPGTYETGSCTVSCAYAPEFRGVTKSQTIEIK